MTSLLVALKDINQCRVQIKERLKASAAVPMVSHRFSAVIVSCVCIVESLGGEAQLCEQAWTETCAYVHSRPLLLLPVM